jgi:hypothetical protein
MLRRLLVCLALGLGTASAAFAAGPDPGVMIAGNGVMSPGGKVRYVARGGAGATTRVVAETRDDGNVLRSATLRGRFGIPAVTFNGEIGGLSPDGSTLVLADTRTGNGEYPLKRHSSLVVLEAKSLRVRERIELPGHYTFDALSPDGSRLYLIQHVSAAKLMHYVVRAYDLTRGQLLPGRIADKTQRGWVMNGMPLTRTTSADGRWVYTFYDNPGGYPFVHALDTVQGVAHCIGIPWKGSENNLFHLRMSVRDGGRTLSIHWRSGRSYLAVATGTWRISHPGVHRSAAPASSFPWWIVGTGLALVALAAVAVLGRRRIAAWRRGPLRLRRA